MKLLHEGGQCISDAGGHRRHEEGSLAPPKEHNTPLALDPGLKEIHGMIDREFNITTERKLKRDASEHRQAG